MHTEALLRDHNPVAPYETPALPAVQVDAKNGIFLDMNSQIAHC